MQDINPITPPVMVGMDPGLVKMMLLIAGGVILLILVIFLVRRFLKSKGRKAGQELIPSIPPYKAALRKLDLLCQRKMGDPKAFYFDLASLIKRYIGGSYSMNALEMTTQELVRQIRFTRMDKSLILGVSQFLTLSDPFRYGPVAPAPSRVKNDLASVRQLITKIEEDLESKRLQAMEEENP
jgi:hypothetical protein